VGFRRYDAPRTARIGCELTNGEMRPRVKVRRSVAGAPQALLIGEAHNKGSFSTGRETRAVRARG
jgi:hypothetical protein